MNYLTTKSFLLPREPLKLASETIEVIEALKYLKNVKELRLSSNVFDV